MNTITLESLANFRIGMRVMRNPENHGLEFNSHPARLGTIGKVVMENLETFNGDWIRRRSGQMWVTWDGDSYYKVVDYRNLKIVD